LSSRVHPSHRNLTGWSAEGKFRADLYERAAQLLGIARQALRTKARELGLSVVRTLEGADEED
jgi:DNA-binding NtrC family response regulator